MRDILAHEYHALDIDVVWDVVQNKLPDLELHVEAILRRLT